ncbi:MAG: hypothetical protein EP312_10110 [Gammaproteobacteria bacterium]|nr:MAG: hypothetical protein EP312_10110 [Gammaproteobacteria bacterium]
MSVSRDQWLQGWQKLSLFTAIVLVGSLLLVWQHHRQQVRQSADYLEVLASQLTATLQPMLLGQDNLAIQRTLDQLVSNHAVTGIRINQPSGAPIAAAGNTSDSDTLSQRRPISFEQQLLGTLEIHTDPDRAPWPWFGMLVLAGGLGGLVRMCWQGWQSLQTLPPPPVVIPPEPETGLQWPTWLDTSQPQTLLCIAITNYASLHNSLSAPMLNRHIIDSLDLLETLPGNALTPIQTLGSGRFALIFASLKEAAEAARRLALELPPLNQQRKKEGLLALRLQACLLSEPDGSEMATAEHRWLDAGQQAQTLLDLASLCEDDDILLEPRTADAVRALYPGTPVLPINSDQGHVRAWRWQPASGLDLNTVDLLEPPR